MIIKISYVNIYWHWIGTRGEGLCRTGPSFGVCMLTCFVAVQPSRLFSQFFKQLTNFSYLAFLFLWWLRVCSSWNDKPVIIIIIIIAAPTPTPATLMDIPSVKTGQQLSGNDSHPPLAQP